MTIERLVGLVSFSGSALSSCRSFSKSKLRETGKPKDSSWKKE
jgi:hypothetical protein